MLGCVCFVLASLSIFLYGLEPFAFSLVEFLDFFFFRSSLCRAVDPLSRIRYYSVVLFAQPNCVPAHHGPAQSSALLGSWFWVKISAWMFPASRAHSRCSFIAACCRQPFAGLSQPGWKLLEGRDAVFTFYSLSCMEHSVWLQWTL